MPVPELRDATGRPRRSCRSLAVDYRTVDGHGPGPARHRPHRRARPPHRHRRALRLRQVLAPPGARRPPAAASRVASWWGTTTSPGCGRRAGGGCGGRRWASCCRTPPTTWSSTYEPTSRSSSSARLRGVDPSEALELLDAVGLADRACRVPRRAVRWRAAARRVRGGRHRSTRSSCWPTSPPRSSTPPRDTCSSTPSESSSTAAPPLVLASHDAAVIDAADDVVRLQDGRVVER